MRHTLRIDRQRICAHSCVFTYPHFEAAGAMRIVRLRSDQCAQAAERQAEAEAEQQLHGVRQSGHGYPGLDLAHHDGRLVVAAAEEDGADDSSSWPAASPLGPDAPTVSDASASGSTAIPARGEQTRESMCRCAAVATRVCKYRKLQSRLLLVRNMQELSPQPAPQWRRNGCVGRVSSEYDDKRDAA
mgnify:CR=1 FL=1